MQYLKGAFALHIKFATSHQYLFSHHQVQHALIIWDKESRKDIYLVDTETPDTLTLRYPGETYRERLLDELEPYFFQVLLTEDDSEIAVILGATFDFQDQLVGMYYSKTEKHTPYFFYLQNGQLLDILEIDYTAVIEQFRLLYPQML
ncbi:hypothetical protein MK805_14875 [Shimazuella sp. AN120528]|uniref:hypothetical protein n=1 Tax=Shimazuella soli TaxID=1892854 RepID=UPI001F0EA1AE|nr:hypothetical protein [Shimazuella soli]MCH5586223.1 hypothetical protein [Shimazuella soli]